MINKHLLVAVGDKTTSSLSLRFVYEFFADRERLELTLFYVIPKTGWGGACKRNPHQKHQNVLDASAVPAMDKARNWLTDMGFPEKNIHVKIVRGDAGVVHDIIRESEEGLYDAAVLGRRGLSWFEEVFSDSVSHRILWEQLSFPIWVCRNPARERQNVLVCVDGSPASLRAVDHVGFVLNNESRHNITLLNVEAGLYSPIGDIFTEPMDILLENGVPRERVSTLVVKDKSAAQVILKLAGEYAAVAVGRNNGKPTGLDRIFGSTSLKILRSLEGAALWLCK